MTHLLQITEGPLRGHYLKGPRSPAEVRRRGYAFTNISKEAWPFATPGEASRKLHAVTRHMGWTLDKLTVVNA